MTDPEGGKSWAFLGIVNRRTKRVEPDYDSELRVQEDACTAQAADRDPDESMDRLHSIPIMLRVSHF